MFLQSKLGSTKEVALSVSLLLQLGEPAQQLSEDYLKCNELHLRSDLSELEYQIVIKSGDKFVPPERISRPSDVIPSAPMDILEFIDTAASGFLSDTSLAVASYNDMFVEHELTGLDRNTAVRQLVTFVNNIMAEYFGKIERRFALETSEAIDDSSLTVRALDRFYR